MKKSILIIVVLFVIVISGKAQKFAYINTDYILESVPSYKSSQDQIDKLSVEWQKEIEDVYAKIDKMYKDYQAEKVFLSDEQKNQRENQIIQKEKEAKDLQKKRFNPKDGDLAKKREELTKPLQDEIYTALKAIAEEDAYLIIFDAANNANIIYSNAKYDLSDKVLKRMGYSK